MGGVALLDSLIALYRTKIKLKKWYHRLVYHFVDMTVVQSWLLYRRDSNEMHVDQKDQQHLLQFKTEIAYSLSKSSNTNRKRGRPSFDVDSLNEEERRRGGAPVLPPRNVRKDGLYHWPGHTKEQGRCRMPGCKGQSTVICTKCTDRNTKAYLCFQVQP